MTQMQWITFGVPVLALALAGLSLLYVRHSAHSFDKRFGPHHRMHPGE